MNLRNINGTENYRAVTERWKKLQGHNKEARKKPHISIIAYRQKCLWHMHSSCISTFPRITDSNSILETEMREKFFDDMNFHRRRSGNKRFIRVESSDVTSTRGRKFIALFPRFKCTSKVKNHSARKDLRDVSLFDIACFTRKFMPRACLGENASRPGASFRLTRTRVGQKSPDLDGRTSEN